MLRLSSCYLINDLINENDYNYAQTTEL